MPKLRFAPFKTQQRLHMLLVPKHNPLDYPTQHIDMFSMSLARGYFAKQP